MLLLLLQLLSVARTLRVLFERTKQNQSENRLCRASKPSLRVVVYPITTIANFSKLVALYQSGPKYLLMWFQFAVSCLYTISSMWAQC